MNNSETLKKMRCPNCGFSLVFHDVTEGIVQVHCRHCKKFCRMECVSGLCIYKMIEAPIKQI